jgi:hypothetical protein
MFDAIFQKPTFFVVNIIYCLCQHFGRYWAIFYVLSTISFFVTIFWDIEPTYFIVSSTFYCLCQYVREILSQHFICLLNNFLLFVNNFFIIFGQHLTFVNIFRRYWTNIFYYLNNCFYFLSPFSLSLSTFWAILCQHFLLLSQHFLLCVNISEIPSQHYVVFNIFCFMPRVLANIFALWRTQPLNWTN